MRISKGEMVKQIKLTKDNYFDIHMSDSYAEITYKEHIVFSDYFCEGLTVLYTMLCKIKGCELNLEKKELRGRLGYWWNKNTDSVDERAAFELAYEKYWLWSTNTIQTWMYRIDNIVFIEISPAYPWHFVEPDSDELYFSFNEFISTYEVIDVLYFDIQQIDYLISQVMKFMREHCTFLEIE